MAAIPTSDPPDAGPAPSTRARVWRVARYVLGLALVGLAVWAVSGKTGELTGATAYLENLGWGWIVFALGAEVASYLAFAGMQRRLLRAGHVDVPLRSMTNITLGGNALQVTLPAGIVISAGWSFRQFRRFGAGDVLCGWVLVAMTALSFISLAVLAGVGLALAASTGSALDLVGVIIGLVLVAGLLMLAWSRRSYLIRHAERAIRLTQRVIHRPSGEPRQLVDEALTKIGAITPSWRDWVWATLMAVLNWVFDMGCLMLAFEAVGAGVPWRGLLLAYGAAQLATNLPITPGGLGVVEGSLTVALVAFGGGQASTVAAVLIYRLISFWLVLPVGWGSVAYLAWTGRRHPPSLVRATPMLTAPPPDGLSGGQA